MSFNEIKCHVNTSLGLVGGTHPLHPFLVSAPACSLHRDLRIWSNCCVGPLPITRA